MINQTALEAAMNAHIKGYKKDDLLSDSIIRIIESYEAANTSQPVQEFPRNGIEDLLRQISERKSDGELTDFGVLRNATIDNIIQMVQDWWSIQKMRESGSAEKRFPICDGTYHKTKTIPWSIAQKAYVVYATKHGGSGQSLERVAERGGFYESEMVRTRN